MHCRLQQNPITTRKTTQTTMQYHYDTQHNADCNAIPLPNAMQRRLQNNTNTTHNKIQTTIQ